VRAKEGCHITICCPVLAGTIAPLGSRFDVCTGAVLQGPAQDPLKTYRVTVDGEVGRVEAPHAQAVQGA